MLELPPLIWPVLLLLAMLMGFVADRTNLCTVSAVAEIIIKRRAFVLWNIFKIVLWILATTIVLNFIFGQNGGHSNSQSSQCYVSDSLADGQLVKCSPLLPGHHGHAHHDRGGAAVNATTKLCIELTETEQWISTT